MSSGRYWCLTEWKWRAPADTLPPGLAKIFRVVFLLSWGRGIQCVLPLRQRFISVPTSGHVMGNDLKIKSAYARLASALCAPYHARTRALALAHSLP
ncbi:hypothetical protein PLICRDRAFT_326122 [Plicaturopsis crispa FD-325 SS-3]|nr:hypothetical protein PLICRDRAFT_326122 [Plicaturopsis crispa FD-325 SS-3]